MKKTFLLLSACAVLALGATSCQKEKDQLSGDFEFTASMESCNDADAKTSFNGTNIHWAGNDTVMLYGNVADTYLAVPDGENSTSAKLRRLTNSGLMGTEVTAIYPAALANSVTSVTLPATQVTTDGNLINNFPMWAYTTDDNLAFKNVFGALKIHLQQENVSIAKIEVTAQSPINGNFNVTNVDGLPEAAYADEGTTTTTLICTEPQDITNGHDFYVTMPAGSYQGLQVTIYRYDNAKRVKSAPAGATIAIQRSCYFTLTIGGLDFAPDPFIDGLISVSDTKQVYFAKGNLIYDNGQWRLGTTQYEAYNNGVTANGPRDLFHPSTVASNYGLDRPTINEADIRNHFVDWGVTVNEDNANDPWYLLTDDEWHYALSRSVSNPRRSNNKCNFGTITLADGSTVDGLILVPDNFNFQDTTGGKHFYGYASSSGITLPSANVYTLQQWAAMEAAGAVFIPCLTDDRSSNSWSRYWTSTIDGSGHLFKIHLKKNSGLTGGSGQLSGLWGVRLVKTVQPQNPVVRRKSLSGGRKRI